MKRFKSGGYRPKAADHRAGWSRGYELGSSRCGHSESDARCGIDRLAAAVVPATLSDGPTIRARGAGRRGAERRPGRRLWARRDEAYSSFAAEPALPLNRDAGNVIGYLENAR